MIEKYEFGSFVVDGKRYDGDITIINKIPQLRNGKGHNITPSEIKEMILKSKAKCIIIGTGYSGGAFLETATSKLIRDAGLRIVLGKTQDVYKKVNQTEDCIALLHATC